MFFFLCSAKVILCVKILQGRLLMTEGEQRETTGDLQYAPPLSLLPDRVKRIFQQCSIEKLFPSESNRNSYWFSSIVKFNHWVNKITAETETLNLETEKPIPMVFPQNHSPKKPKEFQIFFIKFSKWNLVLIPLDKSGVFDMWVRS